MTDKYAIAQLRHAYAHLIASGHRQFAEGLLGPVIEHFERRTEALEKRP